MTETQPQRDPGGRFLKGWDGGPGRKPGTKRFITEDFYKDLHEVWQKGGKKAMQRMMDKTPGDFVKVVAYLMPKQLEIKHEEPVDLNAVRARIASLAEFLEIALAGSEGGTNGAGRTDGVAGKGESAAALIDVSPVSKAK